jgi:hypothetical protein
VIVLKGNKNEDPSGEILRTLMKKAMQVYADKHAKQSVKVTIDIDAYGSV